MSELKKEVFLIITELLEGRIIEIEDSISLIGAGGIFDSMKLLELCFQLEDKATELDFEFDWTSDTAMSKSQSLFKTAGSLADEFIRQHCDQTK